MSLFLLRYCFIMVYLDMPAANRLELLPQNTKSRKVWVRTDRHRNRKTETDKQTDRQTETDRVKEQCTTWTHGLSTVLSRCFGSIQHSNMIRLYRHKKPIIVIIIKKALVVYTQLSIAFSIIHNMTWNGESRNRSTSDQPHIFRTPLQKVT